MFEESYRGRIFIIADPDARLRKAPALDEFITTPSGSIATVANGTKITVSAVSVVPAGSETVAIFVHAHSANGANDFGWTSANNLRGNSYQKRWEKFRRLRGQVDLGLTLHGRMGNIFSKLP